jgi:hypothetical protein
VEAVRARVDEPTVFVLGDLLRLPFNGKLLHPAGLHGCREAILPASAPSRCAPATPPQVVKSPVAEWIVGLGSSPI